MKHGKVTWPGISTCLQCRYTCTGGITPSIASLQFPVEDIGTIQQYGDLTFLDDSQSFTLYDCACGEFDIVDSIGGAKAAQIMIYDRRWKWGFGDVHARFNLRDQRGEPLGELWSPWDIAEWLLDQMGEVGYEIDLPEDYSLSSTPLIQWDAITPAQALMQLCEQFARLIAFQPIQNRVLITSPGMGADWPSDPPMSFSAGVVPNQLPSRVEIVGAPIIYQVAFRTLAVGRDANQSIKPIQDLSIKPVLGWGRSRLRAWRDVTVPAITDPFGIYYGPMTRDEVRALAGSTIWKMWQITLDDPAGLLPTVEIPGLADDAPDLELTSIHQIDILGGIVLAHETDPRMKPWSIPIQGYGQVQAGLIPQFRPFVIPTDLTNPGDSLRTIGFSVDNEYKILISDRPLFATDNGDVDPIDVEPELTFILSVMVRNQAGGYVRYRRGLPLGESDTLPKSFTYDDVQLVRMSAFNDFWEPTDLKTNSVAVNTIADYYLNAHLKQYEWAQTGNRLWEGLLLVDPDGATRQVTWTIGGPQQPTTTQASLNTEHAYWTPPYETLRFQQRLKMFTDPRYDTNYAGFDAIDFVRKVIPGMTGRVMF